MFTKLIALDECKFLFNFDLFQRPLTSSGSESYFGLTQWEPSPTMDALSLARFEERAALSEVRLPQDSMCIMVVRGHDCIHICGHACKCNSRKNNIVLL